MQGHLRYMIEVRTKRLRRQKVAVYVGGLEEVKSHMKASNETYALFDEHRMVVLDLELRFLGVNCYPQRNELGELPPKTSAFAPETLS